MGSFIVWAIIATISFPLINRFITDIEGLVFAMGILLTTAVIGSIIVFMWRDNIYSFAGYLIIPVTGMVLSSLPEFGELPFLSKILTIVAVPSIAVIILAVAIVYVFSK